MTDTSTVLSIIAISIGGFTAVGLCCLGQKPFKDFIYEYFKNMRWSWPFQPWHNKMIYDEILKNHQLAKTQKSTDEALLRVIYHWNPTSLTMPILCEAIHMRSGQIFPIDIICKCADTIDIGDEYYHAWKVINLMTERCVEVVDHGYFKHREKTIRKLIKNIETMTTNFPNLVVDINTTLPSVTQNHQMEAFKEKIIAEQYTILKTSMKLSHREELLDIFVYILNFLIKLVHISSDAEESNKPRQNKLFNVTTQIRIKLAEAKILRYTNFVDEEEVKRLFAFPTPSDDNNVQWTNNFSI